MDIEPVLTDLRDLVLVDFSRAELVEAIAHMERIQARLAALNQPDLAVQGNTEERSASSVASPSLKGSTRKRHSQKLRNV